MLKAYRLWGLQCFSIVPDLNATRLNPRGGAFSRELISITSTGVDSVRDLLRLNHGNANVDVLGIPVMSTEEATC